MDDMKLLAMFNDIDPDILETMGMEFESDEVPDDILAEAGKAALNKAATEAGSKAGKRMGWKSYLAIAAAAAFFIMMIAVSVKAFMPIPSGSNLARNNQLQNDNDGSGAKNPLKLSAIATPEYPEKTKHYWEKSLNPQALDQNFVNILQNFSSQASSAVLLTGESDENQVFSPLSLYMAIAMIANGASGETRNEILKTLSMDNFDMETINQQTKQLFQNLYFDNDTGHLLLSNSLWLDKSVTFKKGLLQNLAQDYYAYSFKADFKDAQKTAAQINEWIAENTGGKLGKDKGTQLKIDPYDIMAILNTVYFYDEWEWAFEAGTAQAQFHLADGTTVKSDFMSETSSATGYVKGDHYMASRYPFKSGGEMIFVLPDQGVSPDKLMKNPQFIAGVIKDLQTKSKPAEVTYRVPKFSYENHFNLKDILKSMGMKKAFLPDLAEFPKIADLKPLFIGRVEQADYISVDEKGCEAASYTVGLPMTGGGEDIVWEKVNLTLDRPFIFIVTLDGGNPGDPGKVSLFVGIVNNPTK